MSETPLQKVVPEEEFARQLGTLAEGFARLSAALLADRGSSWNKRELFALQSEADELEAVLDDHGARQNQAFHYLTELTASIRGFSLAALSLEHLDRRLEGYGVLERLGPEDGPDLVRDLNEARRFTQDSLAGLLDRWRVEVGEVHGVSLPESVPGATIRTREPVRFCLPATLGQEELTDEDQRIAEVSSKFLQACEMLEQAGLVREQDPQIRDRVLRERCNEELARVYEATVHNLQSAYDTHLKNTVVEAKDERLRQLRGHISTGLHMLEAVTQLTHFLERHENGERTEAARRQLSEVVPRAAVTHVALNLLLYWSQVSIKSGRQLANELLPSYTDLQSMEVELVEGLMLHARPASLIVAIVNQYGTPVELEVAGQTCNAGSILELMILVGSTPENRSFVFRGDANPLRDIGLLFEAALGEEGLDQLPEGLAYLRS